MCHYTQTTQQKASESEEKTWRKQTQSREAPGAAGAKEDTPDEKVPPGGNSSSHAAHGWMGRNFLVGEKETAATASTSVQWISLM